MTERAEQAAAAPAPQAFADLQAAGAATASELRRLLRLLH